MVRLPPQSWCWLCKILNKTPRSTTRTYFYQISSFFFKYAFCFYHPFRLGFPFLSSPKLLFSPIALLNIPSSRFLTLPAMLVPFFYWKMTSTFSYLLSDWFFFSARFTLLYLVVLGIHDFSLGFVSKALGLYLLARLFMLPWRIIPCLSYRFLLRFMFLLCSLHGIVSFLRTCSYCLTGLTIFLTSRPAHVTFKSLFSTFSC